MQGEVRNTGGRIYGMEKQRNDEQRRVERVITYINFVHDLMRFTAKRSVIAHTLGEGNPYKPYRDLADSYSTESNIKIIEAMRGLTARINRFSKHFLQLCETFPERFDDADLAMKLIATLEIMTRYDLPDGISDNLKRRLILAKLAHVVDND